LPIASIGKLPKNLLDLPTKRRINLNEANNKQKHPDEKKYSAHPDCSLTHYRNSEILIIPDFPFISKHILNNSFF